jgi:hypothetical protein
MKIKLIFIFLIISGILTSIYYKNNTINNSTKLYIDIIQENKRLDCIEIYINNNNHKTWKDCKGINNKYKFHNLPQSIQNIRIDFEGANNLTFKIKEIEFISSKSKKNLNLNELDYWTKEQLIIDHNGYSINGNDAKIMGSIAIGDKNNDPSMLIYSVPSLILLIIFLQQLYKSKNDYKILEEITLILGFTVAYISAFPGHTNFDELMTLGEYFRGEVSDMHPPMHMLFNAQFIKYGLVAGIMPIISVGIILLIQLMVYWWSIKTIAKIIENHKIRLVFLIILALSPIGMIYSSHIGKDSQMAISLLFSFALIYFGNKECKLSVMIIALAPIFYAYTIRANAPAAVLPILFYWAVSVLNVLKINKKIKTKTIGLVLGVLVIIHILNYNIVNNTVKIKCCGGVQLIMTPVYDLMGISKEIQENLVPEFLYLEKYDLSDINRNFNSTYINWDGLKQANFSQLIPVMNLWLKAILDYPYEFIAHRMNTLKYFFGLQFGAPAFPYMSGFFNNIGATGSSNTTLELIGEYNKISPYLIYKEISEVYYSKTSTFIFYRFWVYILITIAMFICMGYLKLKYDFYLKILIASSVFYTLPYLVLANSAQFRYVYWPALALYIIFFINLDKIIKVINKKDINI